MYVLTMILVDCERLNEVLDGWITAGVEGITVLESAGLGGKVVRDRPSPLFMGFSRIFHSTWREHTTVLALVPTLEVADVAVAATEKIVGPLDEAGNGVAYVSPILKSWGVGASRPDDSAAATE
jgi:hypothetical protein